MTETITLTVREAKFEDVFEDLVRVHHCHRQFSNAGEVIIVAVNGREVPLVARGAHGQDRTSIWLDLKSRQKLGIKPNQQYEFTFKKACLAKQLNWAWHTSSPTPRIAARLGLISVFLGLTGLFLGMISLFRP